MRGMSRRRQHVLGRGHAYCMFGMSSVRAAGLDMHEWRPGQGARVDTDVLLCYADRKFQQGALA